MQRSRPDDPLLASIEEAFESDRPAAALLTIIDSVAALADAPHAAELCETVLAGCYHKADEFADPDGSLGMLIPQVVVLWVQARRKTGADAADTVSTVLSWMEADRYGYCSTMVSELVSALDPPELSALQYLLQCRPDRDVRPWRNLIRAVYVRENRADAYQTLAAADGFPADDCLALARMYAGASPESALGWVERGLASDRAAPYELPGLRRELLARLGRSEEALQSACEDFRKLPSKSRLDEVLRYAPDTRRDEWRERALENATGHLLALMPFFVELGESSRLAAITEATSDGDLEALSHYVTEPAATMLEPVHPLLAARLWRAQAMRILNAGKSKHYEVAIDNLERVRDDFRRAGRDAEWDRTALDISSRHARKVAFMREFQQVLRGEPVIRLSFLEVAMLKWKNRAAR